MKTFSHIYTKWWLLTILFVVIACKTTVSTESTPTTGEVTIVADETFRTVIDAEIQVFNALYPFAKVSVVYKTETEALNDLLKDSTQLIISSRVLTTEERAYFLGKKYFPQEVLIAIDGIALIVNKDNTDSILSMSQLKSILKGEISNWNQINSKSTLGDVSLVFDNTSSSTVRFVIDSICKGSEISKNHSAVKKNSDVIEAVVNNKNLIGVIGVSWVSDRDDSLQMSFLNKIRVMALTKESIATSENSYQPYQAYIAKGIYPLKRNIYFLKTEPREGLATGFAAFLASERGQRIILKAGILPATQPYRIIEVKE